MENEKAFPNSCTDSGHLPNVEQGMDLRDYFAAKALSIVPFIAKERFKNQDCWEPKDYAFEAYSIADEMMKQRLKK